MNVLVWTPGCRHEQWLWHHQHPMAEPQHRAAEGPQPHSANGDGPLWGAASWSPAGHAARWFSQQGRLGSKSHSIWNTPTTSSIFLENDHALAAISGSKVALQINTFSVEKRPRTKQSNLLKWEKQPVCIVNRLAKVDRTTLQEVLKTSEQSKTKNKQKPQANTAPVQEKDTKQHAWQKYWDSKSIKQQRRGGSIRQSVGASGQFFPFYFTLASGSTEGFYVMTGIYTFMQ